LKNQISAGTKRFPTKLLLRLAGTAIALCILLSVTDTEKLAKALENAETEYLLSAILITIASPFLTSFRLKVFLSATGTKVAYNKCLVASLCGLSLNLILPARGGDLVKLAYLRENGKPSWPILAGAALLERGFDVLALGLIGLTASLLLGLQNAAIAAGFVVTATTLGHCHLLAKRPGTSLQSFKKQVAENSISSVACLPVAYVGRRTPSLWGFSSRRLTTPYP
jgi:uncharacterized protein (TIRG00374 family)